MPKVLNLTDPELIAERMEFLRQRQGDEYSTRKRIDPQTGIVLSDGEINLTEPSDFGAGRGEVQLLR